MGASLFADRARLCPRPIASSAGKLLFRIGSTICGGTLFAKSAGVGSIPIQSHRWFAQSTHPTRLSTTLRFSTRDEADRKVSEMGLQRRPQFVLTGHLLTGQ